MKPLFDPEVFKKAIAEPSDLEKARRYGSRFWHEDGSEGIGIGGYKLNGVVYITRIKNLSD